MKKQFAIKPANSSKLIQKSAAKFEATNLLGFLSADKSCGVLPDCIGISKPVYSL